MLKLPLEYWLTRHRRRQVLFALAAIFLLSFSTVILLGRTAPGDDFPGRFRGRVTAVGDDLSLMIQPVDPHQPAAHVALAGLRWPTEWRSAARTEIERQVLGHQVFAVCHGGAGEIYMDDESLLNETLCDRGWAQCEPPSLGADPLQSWLVRVEQWAKRSRRGLWNAES